MEVDIEYPEKLHDEHNDNPLAPVKWRSRTRQYYKLLNNFNILSNIDPKERTLSVIMVVLPSNRLHLVIQKYSFQISILTY